MRTISITQVSFAEAASAWLETRRPYLKESTFSGYADHLKTLSIFFGEMRLPEIDGDHIRAFQRMRMAKAGASIINRECSVLQQMLKRIGRWVDIQHDYQPLPLPKESPGRALTEQEEERLYRIGPTNPNWEVAYCTMVISLNSTAGPGELRHLRLADIDLQERCFRAGPEGAKNLHRMRSLPLNDEAFRAMEYLYKRALRLGASSENDYLLPFRIHRKAYDFTRPCKGWRTAHNEMSAACGIRIRRYDFRHHAITRLLENPDVSEETVEAIAGHVSHKMKKRYSHIRMKPKREAVEALTRIMKRPASRVLPETKNFEKSS
jgi:integrase